MSLGTVGPIEAIRASLELCRSGRMELTETLGFIWPNAKWDRHHLAIIGSILEGLETDLNEIGIKGCTKAGKGAAVAAGINLWFESRNACKVTICSTSWDHAATNLFAEVLKWRKTMQVRSNVKENQYSVYDDDQRNIIIANPKSGEGFSGRHSEYGLFVFDEATGVPQAFYDQAKTQAALIAAISNPRTTSGWFRRMFPPGEDGDRNIDLPIPGGRRRLVTVGGADCINVISGDTIIPGQIERWRYQALKASTNQRWSRIMADGKFPLDDPMSQIILESWLQRHTRVWRPGLPVSAFGLDVARSDAGDRTVFVAGGDKGIAGLFAWQTADLMEVCGKVIATARQHYGIDLKDSRNPICVDMDGIGAGVGDRLRELGVWVIEHRGSAAAEDRMNYGNMRAESYAMLGSRLDPEGAWPLEEFALPPAEQSIEAAELLEEICAPMKIYGSDGIKFKITPKGRTMTGDDNDGETLMEMLGRSPDCGDGCVYFYRALRHMINVIPHGAGGRVDGTWTSPTKQGGSLYGSGLRG